MGFEPGCVPAGDGLCSLVVGPRAATASPSVTPSPINPTEPADYSLSRDVRLRGRYVFTHLSRHGHTLQQKGLKLRAVHFTVALTPPALKVAFVVRKRHLRRAVHRNRTKRLLREAFRHLRPTWQSKLPGETWLLWQWEQPIPPTEPMLPLMDALLTQLHTRLCAGY